MTLCVRLANCFDDVVGLVPWNLGVVDTKFEQDAKESADPIVRGWLRNLPHVTKLVGDAYWKHWDAGNDAQHKVVHQFVNPLRGHLRVDPGRAVDARRNSEREIRDYLKGKVAAIAPLFMRELYDLRDSQTDARCRGHLDDAINNIVGFATAGARTSLSSDSEYAIARKLTPAQEEDVVRRYKKRESVSSLAKAFGVSRVTIDRILVRHGAKTKRRDPRGWKF